MSSQDRQWLGMAIDLSRLSPRTPTRYAVGAVIVDHAGAVLATGYTGESDPRYHAEEVALAKLADQRDRAATIYTSLEPCTTRRSRPHSCTELILATGIRRVVFAMREPLVFADCHGVEALRHAGVEVVEFDDLGRFVRDANAHVLDRAPLATVR